MAVNLGSEEIKQVGGEVFETDIDGNELPECVSATAEATTAATSVVADVASLFAVKVFMVKHRGREGRTEKTTHKQLIFNWMEGEYTML